MPKSNEGQLSLKVIRAIDLQETGVLKYQDPFVTIETSRAKFETEVARGAGSDPEWKAAFEFQVGSGTAVHSDSHKQLLNHGLDADRHQVYRICCVYKAKTGNAEG